MAWSLFGLDFTNTTTTPIPTGTISQGAGVSRVPGRRFILDRWRHARVIQPSIVHLTSRKVNAEEGPTTRHGIARRQRSRLPVYDNIVFFIYESRTRRVRADGAPRHRAS